MLPFLAGLAVGTALTILYAKRDEVKKAVSSPAFKGKVEDTKRASIRAFDDVKDKTKQIFANLKGEIPKNSKSAKSTAEKTPAKRGRKAGAKSTTTAKSSADKGTATKTTRAKRGTGTKSTTTRAKRGTATAKSTTGTKTRAKRATTTRAKQTTASAPTSATNPSENSVVSTSNADTNLI